jgi:hypothetical protein
MQLPDRRRMGLFGHVVVGQHAQGGAFHVVVLASF